MHDSNPMGWIITIIFTIALGIGGLMWGMPHYSVWQQGLAGQAEFSRAEQNRKITIEVAKAKYEAAKMNAAAEIEQAKGAAMANEIMTKSLDRPGAENYLRWRYIHMLEESAAKGKTDREIIYIPVDGLLPMTEAGRASVKGTLSRPLQ